MEARSSTTSSKSAKNGQSLWTTSNATTSERELCQPAPVQREVVTPTAAAVPAAAHRRTITMCSSAARAGFEIAREPVIPTPAGPRKPDLIAHMGRFGIVVDAQVTNDQQNMRQVYSAKREKYDNDDINQFVRSTYKATNICHLPVILSWRGLWCDKSASDLLTLGTCNRRDLAVIATRVLIGGAIIHRDFTYATSVR
uniref:Uncharacterized protein n=1 Tax=Trichogramma kaykai TaxID=54128 RepID=A0ABD2W219_9HYME